MHIKNFEVTDFGMLDHILNNITSSVFVVDKDAKMLAFNEAFTHLFPYSQENIIGQYFGEVIKCKNNSSLNPCGTLKECGFCQVREILKSTIKQKTNHDQVTIVKDIWEGENLVRKYLRFSTKSIINKGEEVVLAIVDDITTIETQKIMLEAQNEKLVEMNEMKNRYLGIAAHDLRSPISAIQGCSWIIMKTLETASREELVQLIEIINEKSRFSLNLIDDLLDLAKIEAGHPDIHPQIQNYQDFIENHLRMYKPLANTHQVDIDLEFKDHVSEINFDKNKLAQVLNNLLDNALKYSEEGSKIKVEVFSDNGSVVTRIIDHGPGIESSDQENIFKPFHRSASETTGRGKSTGLGLSIVKKIIEGHNGQVSLESTVGKGSIFSFMLPVT